MNKKKLAATLLLGPILLLSISSACAAQNSADRITSIVRRGDLEVKVSVDGNIEVPAAVNLYFDTTMFTPPYSAKIKEIYVEKGDIVKAGALLAKLDDTAQKLAVEAAQYTLELALNNVVQTVCCGVTRSPGFYSDAVALKRFEFARQELERAQTYLQDGRYEASAEQMVLARLDLEGVRDFYSDTSYRNVRPDLNDINQNSNFAMEVEDALNRVTDIIDGVSQIEELYKEGRFENARGNLSALLINMDDAYSAVKRLNHLPGGTTFADSCTAYTVISEVMSSLDMLDKLAKEKEFDGVRYAEMISRIRHELELTDKVINENISVYRQGLNLKALRDYNINIQTAIINLERAKQALLKTELIAPFDGRIEDINLRAGDLIVQRYSTTGAPIDSYVIRLANLSYIRMTGMVDEIGAVKIKAGQKARVFIDADPGRQYDGTVKFISSFGPLQSSGIQYYGTIQSTVPTYKVEIEMEREQAQGLYGGLSATAEILIDKKTDVLIVPNEALRGKNGDYTVRVVHDRTGGLIEERPVKIGLQTRTQSEVLSGLTEGEVILLDKVSGPVRPLNIKK
jgi:RND family efflux transporter MFP subunit